MADDEPEPEEGDLFTHDHTCFFECGSTSCFQVKLGLGAKVIVPHGEDWQQHVRAYMKRVNFWPNVWFVSDHGNTCLLSLENES